MPSLRGRGRGDQRVVVNVIVPRRLNAEQRDLLERFSETLDGRNLGDEREPLVQKLRRVLR
jgi:molecular chaperone DnaJ